MGWKDLRPSLRPVFCGILSKREYWFLFENLVFLFFAAFEAPHVRARVHPKDGRRVRA